jgi:hypothetical protein
MRLSAIVSAHALRPLGPLSSFKLRYETPAEDATPLSRTPKPPFTPLPSPQPPPTLLLAVPSADLKQGEAVHGLGLRWAGLTQPRRCRLESGLIRAPACWRSVEPTWASVRWQPGPRQRRPESCISQSLTGLWLKAKLSKVSVGPVLCSGEVATA